MKWNKKDLEEKLEIIEEKIKTVYSNDEIKYLKYEASLVKFMLFFIKSNETDEKIIADLNITQSSEMAKANFFNKYLSEITKSFNFKDIMDFMGYYIFANVKVSSEEYLTLIEEFLEQFEMDLLSIYRDCNKENRINLTQTDYFKNRDGFNLYLPTFQKSYIYALSDGKIKKISILPHELTHAFQFQNFNHKQVHLATYSALREALPLFVELAFFDFLKNTKYYKIAYNNEIAFFDSLLLTQEYNYKFYVKSKKIEIKNNRLINNTGESASIREASSYLSKILAYYFINIYRNNRNNIKTIAEFNQYFGCSKEYDFFGSIKLEDLTFAIKAEANKCLTKK